MKAAALCALLLLAISLTACGSSSTPPAPTSQQQSTFAGTWAGEYSLAPSEDGSELLFFAATLVSESPVNGNCTFSGTPVFTVTNLTGCFIADPSAGLGSIPCCAGTSPDVVVIGTNGSTSVLVFAAEGVSAYSGSGTSEMVNGSLQVNGTWQCVETCVGLFGPFTLTKSP